jgi:hypothetical protein
MKIRYSLLFVLTIVIFQLSAQDWNIGIRAGLSQSKFVGPLDPATETYSLSGGFHFGINFQWNFSDVIGVRSEILYTQNGGKYSFNSPNGYYVFNKFNNPRFVLRDETDITLKHSNAYIQFPQTAHFRFGEKLELFAGPYIALMLSPTATGTLVFGGDSFEQEHSFRQGLNYNYRSDQAGEFEFNSRALLIRVTGDDVDLPGVVGAYYLYQNKEASRFYGIDYGVIGGASYYLNRSLYLMGRIEYGLKDITNASADVSYADVNDNGTLIFLDQNDRNLSFNLSIGFKF